MKRVGGWVAVFSTLAAASLTACSADTGSGESVGASQEGLTAPNSVPGFALLASGHVAILDRTQVTGGDIGAAAAVGDAINTATDTKVGIGKGLIGQRIVLGDRTIAGNLFTNQPVAPHATYASLSPFSAPPAPPSVPAFTAGSTPLTVNGGQTVTKAAGSFGQVTVNGTLNLSGGTYLFQNLTLGPGGALVATSASVVRVAGRISGADRARIASTSNAAALRVFVAGANNTTGGVVLGQDARLTALLVSNAAFQAGDRFIASGAVAASDISLAHDSTFTFDTGFGCSTNTACNDSNPCTTDACVDTQCQHTAAPDGTSCSDSNACTGSDHCQAATCVPGAPVACDDGLFCNGTETCSTGSGCAPGTPPVISDGVACTIDSCNEATDHIDHVPDNEVCASGFSCDATQGCVDVDECANGTANCDPNATCTNTPGGFTCACNSNFTGDSKTCTQACTPETLGFGVQRCVLARPDGTVDLFLSPADAPNSAYTQNYCQNGPPVCPTGEPDVNFCGPTAGKNLLTWYGADPSYQSLGSSMKTNTWDSDKLTEVCSVAACSVVDLLCDAACAVVAGEAIGSVIKAGSLPSDVNPTMDSLAPPGYVRCNDKSDITLAQLQWSLAHGNPVMFLESRGSGNLHWTIVTGIYNDANGKPMLRIANDDGDVSFSDFQADIGLGKVGTFDGLAIDTVGVSPTIIRYAKATDVLPGNICDDWHSSDLTQAAGGPPVPPTAVPGSLVGYQTTFNGQNQQHVVFVGSNDAHVHELFYTDHWQQSDLNAQATNATDTPPLVAPGSVLVAYTTAVNNQEHVDYVSADGHVNELMFDTAWHWKDVTADTSAPAAVVTGSFAGFATNYNNQQHINFIDSASGHVWELFIGAGDTHWQKSDLTATAKTDNGASPPAPRANSPLTGYATNFNSQEHVDFVDGSGHVWELFFASAAWHAVDVTMKAGAPSPDAASPLSAYATDFNSQQHIDFIGADKHVHEMFFASQWLSSDLNVIAGIPATLAGTTTVHGYVTDFNSQQHVDFVSAGDNHVRELFFANQTSGWQARDLTNVPAPPAPLPSGTSLLTGYETTFNKQQHIDYIGANGHVYELFL